jgi:hypothetical protein
VNEGRDIEEEDKAKRKKLLKRRKQRRRGIAENRMKRRM